MTSEQHHEVSILQLLHLEPRDLDTARHGFSPLVSWLIALLHPALTVELGPGDRPSLLSTCDAVSRIGRESRCLAVGLPAASGPDTTRFLDVVAECSERYPSTVTGDAGDTRTPAEIVGEAKVGLLHLSLFDLADTALPDFPAWFDVCAPGTTMVVTTTASGASSAYTRAERVVSERYPSVRVPLGGTTEALVAQVPVGGAVPAVEILRSVPSAVGRYLAVLGEPLDTDGHLDDETVSPRAVRAVVAGLVEGQVVERQALLSAIESYRNHAEGLALELHETRQSLAAQVESARLEREQLLREFLDRLDVLSAKISTSAARFSAELAEKDRLLEEQEQKTLAYAGLAATAQSVIDDMHRSSSWRMTAPLRLLSRLAARRPPQPAD